MNDKVMNYTVKNSSTEIILIIEPWAEEVLLPPNPKLSIYISYLESRLLESEITPKCFVVYVWGGCRARVFLDDEDVTPPSLQIRTVW